MSDEKFLNKFRTMSHRLRGWDYDNDAKYFITIVTAHRQNHFGEIVNGKMILNDIGQIVYDEFVISFSKRRELYLGAFVIMPNHLHTILILDNTDCNIECNDGVVLDAHNCVGTCNRNIDGMNDGIITGTCNRNIVETHGRASLQQPVQQPVQQPATQPLSFIRKPHSISSFVAGFKSATVNRIDDWIDENHKPMQKFNRNNPLWQRNYHDHIIRNEAEYNRIKTYIENNPAKWESSHNGRG